jgi:ribosomal protein S20
MLSGKEKSAANTALANMQSVIINGQSKGLGYYAAPKIIQQLPIRTQAKAAVTNVKQQVTGDTGTKTNFLMLPKSKQVITTALNKKITGNTATNLFSRTIPINFKTEDLQAKAAAAIQKRKNAIKTWSFI